MKRRSFLQGVAAAAAAPLVPIQSLAGITSGGMTAAGAQPYLWAEFISRVHNRASPAMFERLLKLDSETARRVYGELLSDKVLTPPDAFGLSRAVQPYPQAHVAAGVRTTGGTGASARKPELPKRVLETPEPETEETTDPADQQVQTSLTTDVADSPDEPDTER